ncbi:hypothetical protein DERP_006047 [Dermatophagoides pteronyssinus]|uniref:Uncharacterized protein n=1 Tax=Dermatophagoides pteronyssinus TaxID=6956 RepID=A0ABQ8JS49_DERPT|nr:hypothetical protein DERP_006047 [Dermatophagoides pteronyssinus]
MILDLILLNEKRGSEVAGNDFLALFVVLIGLTIIWLLALIFTTTPETPNKWITNCKQYNGDY